MKAYGRKGMKICINELDHMTKMAATPIRGEKLKNLLQNKWNDGLKNWYVVLGTRVLPRLFK